MTKTALILVDIQYDFIPPDGSLAVNGGDQILSPVYRLLDEAADHFDLIVASQAYHPVGHVSFASTHGKAPFAAIEVPKLHAEGETVTQMLWPDHCIQGTHGCEIEKGIQHRLDSEELKGKVEYVRKGSDLRVDAYSAFADNQYTFFTALTKILHQHHITDTVVCGLATDYCVRATAIDACKFGFKTKVLTDAIRAVDAANAGNVLSELEAWGCSLVTSSDV